MYVDFFLYLCTEFKLHKYVRTRRSIENRNAGKDKREKGTREKINGKRNAGKDKREKISGKRIENNIES